MKQLFLASALAILPVTALACPAVPDRAVEVARLIEGVRAAENANAAQLVTNKLWEIWATAPDAKAQDILDRGLIYRSDFNLEAAAEAFGQLVDYCPHYAEGYNQRAFVNFMQGDYAAALPDLERALDRDPTHIAALAGRALTLFGLGRMKEGRAVLRDALVMNPWLPERHMLDGFEHEVDEAETEL